MRQQFETNVFGWQELTNLLLPVMRKQGYGRVIQNSSVLGFAAMPYRGAYNCSKFALEGLSDTLRMELAGYYQGVYVPHGGEDPSGHEFGDYARTRYMYGRAASIYGGSNEIQKNIIAKAVLGLG